MPGGDCRQYSLAGTPGDPLWRIAVLREAGGRGGSRWLHDDVAAGTELQLGGPRNHFAYQAGSGPVRFIAGGIGITPLLPMIAAAQAAGRDWQLDYLGRARAAMPFLHELAGHGSRVRVHARDQSPRPDVAALVAALAPGTGVYCCGPERLMQAVERAGAAHGAVQVHVERFAPMALPADRGLDEFEVEFAHSGKSARVTAGQSILQAAEAAGIEVPTSCREGTCGSCETPILEGCARHLDSVLSEQERQAGRSLMICISRATTPRLVIDL